MVGEPERDEPILPTRPLATIGRLCGSATSRRWRPDEAFLDPVDRRISFELSYGIRRPNARAAGQAAWNALYSMIEVGVGASVAALGLSTALAGTFEGTDGIIRLLDRRCLRRGPRTGR
jgi:hypothetical protein